MAGVSEGQGDGEFKPAAEINFGGERDVALQRMVILPVHLVVVGQVLPSIVDPDVTAGTFGERNGGGYGQPGAVLVRGENWTVGDMVDLAVVAPAPNLQLGGAQCIDLQFFQDALFALAGALGQNRSLMGIADDFLDDAIPAFGIRASDFETQGAAVEALGVGVEIRALVMEESFAVGDEKLEIAQLGTIDRGIVNLVQDAAGEGVPDPAGRRISGADGFFGAARPAGLHSWSSRSGVMAMGDHADFLGVG